MLPSYAFIPFFSLPLPPSLPHSLSGRAVPEGPAQRVMAAAEARSIGSFHSESGFRFWGQGAGQSTHKLTACRLWRGTSMGWGCSPHLLPCLPSWGHRLTFMEVSCQRIWCASDVSWARSMVVVVVVEGPGPCSAKMRCTSGRAAGVQMAARDSVRACACGRGWRLCMDCGLAAFLRFRKGALSFEYTLDAYTP